MLTDDPIGEIMVRTRHLSVPPLAEMLGARARGQVLRFPDLAAANLAAYQQLVIEAIGETPASRSASDVDNRRWLAQQLSLVVELRAQLRLERARSLELLRTIEHVHALLNEGDYDDAEAVLLDAVEPDDDAEVCRG